MGNFCGQWCNGIEVLENPPFGGKTLPSRCKKGGLAACSDLGGDFQI